MGDRAPYAGPTASDVERAVAQAKIVRTWPMRGTIHFVAAKDIRWMVELLAPRVIRRFASYYRRQRLDAATFTRSRRVVVDHLSGGKRLDRPTLYAGLEKAGIRTKAMRGLFILGRLAMEGTLCFGPKSGNQPTFALVDEFVPSARSLDRTESLRELARRYFTSHGPATTRDLAWWAGLGLGEAKKAADLASDRLSGATIGGEVFWSDPDPSQPSKADGAYLLPTYDEFLIGYKDRSAALGPGARKPDNLFTATIVADARVIGFWRRTANKDDVQVTTRLFQPATPARARQIGAAAKRYGDFFGQRVRLLG